MADPDRDEGALIDYLDAHVPRHATVALTAPADFPVYPFFGSALSHRVLVGGTSVQAKADTIVFDHGPPRLACAACWRTALRYPSGWGLLVRVRRAA